MKNLSEIIEMRILDVKNVIGSRIRDARKMAQITQADLAKITKLSLTTINRVEKGKQLPHPDNLKEIAHALKISMDRLLELPPPANSSPETKAELIIEITSRLATLNEDELGAVLSLMNGFPSQTARRGSSAG